MDDSCSWIVAPTGDRRRRRRRPQRLLWVLDPPLRSPYYLVGNATACDSDANWHAIACVLRSRGILFSPLVLWSLLLALWLDYGWRSLAAGDRWPNWLGSIERTSRQLQARVERNSRLEFNWLENKDGKGRESGLGAA